MGKRHALRLVAGCLLAAAVGAACGGGGGGGGGGGPIEPPASSLTFTPAQNQPDNSIALVRTNGSDANQLVVELRARGVTDLYGVGFDLSFPVSLRYDGASEGTWLSSGGAAQTTLQVAAASNRLTVGLSRLGGVTGVSGDGALLSLRFTAVAAGNGGLEFANPEAFNSTTTAFNVQWIGGTVSVVR
jgi:hypothetical protein